VLGDAVAGELALDELTAGVETPLEGAVGWVEQPIAAPKRIQRNRCGSVRILIMLPPYKREPSHVLVSPEITSSTVIVGGGGQIPLEQSSLVISKAPIVLRQER
jgi:hypothetical protein